jgi:hypothetical protein
MKYFWKRIGFFAIANMLALAAPASAASPQLPAPMLGTWCFDVQTTEDSERYQRGECDSGNQLVIGPRSFDRGETECNLIKTAVRTDRKYRDIYTLSYRCQHLGPNRRTFRRAFDAWLKEDHILIVRQR